MTIKWFPGNREPYHWVITMKRIILLLFAILCLALVAWSRFGEELGEVITVFSQLSQPEETVDPDSAAVQTVQAFAREQGLTLGDWPEDLLVLLDKNPETEEFVLQYPLKKDSHPTYDLSDCLNSTQMPLLLQWDERWGYGEYAGELMGISGCGPTCLSMVCIQLLQDASYTPQYVAAFAEENGYAVKGNGSAWALISEGGEKLGLDVTEIPLDEGRIIRNLEVGNPIICVMGPGDFTTSGHFIVLTQYADGYVKVNDPNSPIRSQKQWKLTDIMPQMNNLWVCR